LPHLLCLPAGGGHHSRPRARARSDGGVDLGLAGGELGGVLALDPWLTA
jgi:hypothetical protein